MNPSRGWKPLAWNGIRLEIPAAWDPSGIGRRFLMLEDRDGPTLSLRWEPIAGRFDPVRTLRKLTRAAGANADMAPADLPPLWEKAMKSSGGSKPHLAGFRWRDGIGALIHRSDDRTAILAAFHGESPPPAAAPLLASLRSVVGKPTRPFILYDIRARVPAEFNLDRFRFLPGAFELEFSGTGTYLRFHRWGPASMLLDGAGLETFAHRRIPEVPKDAKADGETLDWEASVGGPLGAILPGKRPRFEAGRIWRPPESDRILGIVAAAPTREAATKSRNRAARDFGILRELAPPP